MSPSVVVSLSLILFGSKLPNQGKGMFLGLSVLVKAAAMEASNCMQHWCHGGLQGESPQQRFPGREQSSHQSQESQRVLIMC